MTRQQVAVIDQRSKRCVYQRERATGIDRMTSLEDR
jgi:hypothetical protein